MPLDSPSSFGRRFEIRTQFCVAFLPEDCKANHYAMGIVVPTGGAASVAAARFQGRLRAQDSKNRESHLELIAFDAVEIIIT